MRSAALLLKAATVVAGTDSSKSEGSGDSSAAGNSPITSTDEIAVENWPDVWKQPCTLGALKAELASVRERLEWHQMVWQTQLRSMNDTTDAKFDTLQVSYEHLAQSVTALSGKLEHILEKELDRNQRHVDDRLENIRDTLKLTAIVFFAMVLWFLFTNQAKFQSHLEQTKPESFVSWLLGGSQSR